MYYLFLLYQGTFEQILKDNTKFINIQIYPLNNITLTFAT